MMKTQKTTALILLASVLCLAGSFSHADVPTSTEIITACKEFVAHDSKAGFVAYVRDLYSGENTNYIPAIALSGLFDREYLGEFESSSNKFQRIRAFQRIAPEVYKKHRFFFDEAAYRGIGLVASDLEKSRNIFLNWSMEGGWRDTLSRRINYPHFKELDLEPIERLLRNAPDIFIPTNAMKTSTIKQNKQ